MIIQSKFKPGDEVKIVASNIKAEVIAVHIGVNLKPTYSCEWWNDTTCTDRYFGANQLEFYNEKDEEETLIVMPDGKKATIQKEKS